MASNSPRARIDQFFAAKKRKPQSTKDEKFDKNPSPSKGSLENFLVKSDSNVVSPKLKRNLTKEINLSLDSVHETKVKDLVRDEGKNVCSGSSSELKKFASDFLSLYCSEMPPTADSSMQQHSKGQKRNGSPSLVACSKISTKKQCILDQTEKVISSSSKEDEGVKMGPTLSETPPCKDFGRVEGRDDVGCFSLIRCNNMLDNSRNKNRTIDLNTPKTSSRNSLFSPGEEFWNEAIEVADGLYVQMNDNPILADKSSCAVAKPGENDIKENATTNKASPLPVRHFDFSHEGDTTIVETAGKCSTVVSIEKAKCAKTKSGSSSLIVKRVGQVTENASSLHPPNERSSYISTHMNATIDGSASNSIVQVASTPSSSKALKDHLQIASWLPSDVCKIYMKKGISKLYPWQVDCLLVDGVLEKRNLVYCASTSAGKSFVAEILMLRRVISTEKMALIVLPYVSICAEKAEHLELLLEPLGKHVRSYYGNQGGGSLPKDTSVAVCTIEKANSLINRLVEEGRLSEVGIIVIDELHMVGDQHRGYLLELMLTKLRYASGEGNSESNSDNSSGSSSGKGDPAHGMQIVGMSATMPNVASVADWLQAALYETDFRPVPLEEYIKVGSTIYNKNMEVVRTLAKASELGGKDVDHIVELCNEVVQEGHSVLLFCSSRKGCEATAKHVAKYLKNFSPDTRKVDCDYDDAFSAVEALKKCPAGLDPVLEETLPCGVAYHHAGLTVEEREIIETCYRKGIVRVLTATSTLAAGVNLPARRVIFRQPRIGRDFIDGTRYRQMSGRAGRTGIDTKGESILICKPEEVKRISSILNDSCPPLQSCLSEDKNGMTHAILEVVAGGIVQTASDINRYVRCTLLNSTKPFQDVVKSAQDSLRWLCQKKFLEWNEETKVYSTTPLGRASFGSSLTPEESLVVLNDLARAREGFVLASDLHLVYLVTPINVEVEPDWELYYERFMELSALDQSVGNRVGVLEPFLMRMAHGAPMGMQERFRGKRSGVNENQKKRNTSSDSALISSEQTLRVCKRFYVSLMLSRLVQEVPVLDVCEAFKVARGMIQSLQENAGRFAQMVSVFCERLGWHDFEGLVSKFQNRVSFGVRAEIAELTTIPYVKGSRARALYKAGLRTSLSIAEASTSQIAKALFETSSWAGQQGPGIQRVQMSLAKKIKNGARKIVLDQAEEARIAAFSTFTSLGIDVPKMSPPLFHANFIRDSPPHEKHIANGTYENPKVPAGILNDVKNTLPNGISQNVTIQKLGAEDNNEAILLAEEKESHNMEVDRSLVGPSTLYNSSSCNVLNTEESLKATCYVEDKKYMPDQARNDTENMYEPTYSNTRVSDQGPTNASNFAGGFDSFLDHWEAIKEFYFDVHFSSRTDSNSSIQFDIIGLAICWENSPVYYVSLSKDITSFIRLSPCRSTSKSSAHGIKASSVRVRWNVAKSRWNRMVKIMSQNGVRKITWNLKSQIQVLKFPSIAINQLGKLEIKELSDIQIVDDSYIMLPPISVHDGIDLCIVSWILWPDEESKTAPNLEKVVKKRLSSEEAAAANRSGRWRNQMRKAAHDGCCRRVAQSRALGSVLLKLLVSENLVDALSKIEKPLVTILADMELCGIGVDMEGCLRARNLLVKKLKELEKEAYTLAGISFSLNSTADIADLLYTRLKLPVPQGCKKGKLHPSTDKHSLDMLRGQHPIISVIREHRTLAKLNGTLGSICSRARLCMKSQRYIVKGYWLQVSTATGRLSMEEPNLQCVEHSVAFTINHPEYNSQSSQSGHQQVNPRDFFIPTQENWILLTADYSQIELRLMAHFSKDSSLIELLSKPDGDCFTMIAARWTGKLESTINSDERDQTKRLIYGILYGMGASSLAEQLECSAEEATRKIKNFKNSFPAVSAWLNEAVASCRHKGYIETLFGRKRFLSKIKLGNSKEKAKAERQAVNSICQGSAADVIKIAMITIHTIIAEGFESPSANILLAEKYSMLKGHCRIILQVHDELVLEVDPRFVKEAGSLLKTCMENAASLAVPLRVKLMVGKTWGSSEPFQLEP